MVVIGVLALALVGATILLLLIPENKGVQQKNDRIIPLWMIWSSIQNLPGGWVFPYNAYQVMIKKGEEPDD